MSNKQLLFRLSQVLGLFLILIILYRLNIISFNSDLESSDDSNNVTAIDTSLFGTIDEESGLVIDHGFELVKTQCGSCHSAKLVAQNGLSREGWTDLIRWMQKEQNLWDLGAAEVVILDYLEKNCSPRNFGRRKQLEVNEWYVLNE